MSQDKSTTPAGKTAPGFTAEERAAMKERSKELKAEVRAHKNRAAGESGVLKELTPADEARISALIARAES